MHLALRVAAIYAVVSVVWILFSDRLVDRLPPSFMSEIQTFKGVGFVLISAVLIFFLIARHDRHRRLLDLALEAHPSGILIADMQLRVTYANSSITDISGYRPSELIGRNPRVLGSDLTPPAVFTAMHHALDKGESWSGEFLNRRKSGELYWASTTITPLTNGRGRVISYVGAMTDITSEKRTQSAILEAKNLAEEANRTKSDFLANMSHELRTPLNAIVGFTDLLRRGYAGVLTPSQQEYIDNIAKSSEHLLGVINSVLDLSKVELGHFRVELSELELNQLVGECLNMLDSIALKKDVAIRFQPARESIRAISDRQAVRQIIANIVGNAIKFSPGGSYIDVRTDQRAEEFVITVADQGPGMSSEQMSRIFEPFQSRSAHNANQTEGTGLGLSICRKLVDALGGYIRFSSREGEGTSVVVTLPLNRQLDHVGSSGTPDRAAGI
jgi:PAS domain S-box-containing protein